MTLFEKPQQARSEEDAGGNPWQAYFAHTDVHTVREEHKLNRHDVGWYQSIIQPFSVTAFEAGYLALTEKLQPMVCNRVS